MEHCILGISAYYHDSAAALIINGEVVAAAQEERFTRIKHDAAFPINAIQYVLEEAGLRYEQLTAVAFYDKPLLKFERLLETYHAFAPAGLRSFFTAIPAWLREKLFIKRLLRKHLRKLGGGANVPVYFPEHHLSHAASAFYPSPFREAAILTIDGVGEWATTTICHGEGNNIKILQELRFPHSVGLLYSAFTHYLGFKVNSGEYKLMGLAPYGPVNDRETAIFKDKILTELVDLREDGSILLNMRYFNFATGLTMTNNRLWERLFGLPPRKPEGEISQSHMNLALAIQQVTETIVVMMARTAQRITGSKRLVMAGGVALNCVANTKIALDGVFEDIWIQPAAGDAGGALGAALAALHIALQADRKVMPGQDAMKGALLGPAITRTAVEAVIQSYNATATYIADAHCLTARVGELLAAGNIVGWCHGRMEFGPRALGNRSILADPRNPEMQQRINLKVKLREGFRPFAPAVLEEDAQLYFQRRAPSPYMLFVTALLPSMCITQPTFHEGMPLYERLRQQRSVVPAVTHVDYSARLQTVHKDTHPVFWQLIHQFKQLTGCGLLINTSFNMRGEPIVCTAEDAFLAFMRTGLDYLVMDHYLFDHTKQTGVQNILPACFMPD
ncbi:carbamoyltransferase [Chitinophaga agrisoli]|uniref:Carbamoyltransferase n=1 Tax=Chitinophaga agrisoli TaxID=2607653 RepID=A0A5B2VWY5_9BACT|nr:carbamoyltransferase [Chitinophaga agrisoli]KAA2243605.1 carbamoyltransferase [Chitinophaga agrisoli]